MLTKHQKDEASFVASGIISLNSALDLTSIHSHDSDAVLRGTLILAGEEDDAVSVAGNHHREVSSSRLSLPESGLLPSELTLNKDAAFIEDTANDGSAAKRTNEADNIGSSHQSTLLPFATLLLLSTTIAVLIGYIHNLKQTVTSLESQLQQHAAKSNTIPTDDIFNHSNNTYIYENCYFKAAFTPGACSQDVQSWIHKYIKTMYPYSDSCTTHNDDYEEVFLYQLLDRFKSITYQSYSFVEDGLRNVTFDSQLNLNLASLFDSLSGLHQHYDPDNDKNNTIMLPMSFTDVANTVLDEGSALVKLIERRAGEAASTIVDSTAVWLRNVLELVSEEDLVAWN